VDLLDFDVTENFLIEQANTLFENWVGNKQMSM
jgi:hypothetical protein